MILPLNEFQFRFLRWKNRPAFQRRRRTSNNLEVTEFHLTPIVKQKSNKTKIWSLIAADQSTINFSHWKLICFFKSTFLQNVAIIYYPDYKPNSYIIFFRAKKAVVSFFHYQLGFSFNRTQLPPFDHTSSQ